VQLDSLEYKGYFVREDGAVFNSKGQQIKPTIIINRNGRRYPKYRLKRGGQLERWFAHRLVAWLYFGPFESLEEFKKLVVDHIDNDPMNPAVWNLEVLGHKENLKRRREEFHELSQEVPF
jgi:hypothetical protein